MPLNNHIVRNIVRAAEVLEARSELLDLLKTAIREDSDGIDGLNVAIDALSERAMKLMQGAIDEADRLRKPSTAGEQGVPGSDSTG